MPTELVRLTTSDKKVHFGAFYPPSGRARDLGVIHVHGMTGSFVGPLEGAIAPFIASAGYPILVANNRGHDLLGAALEDFAGCLPDIQSYFDFMEARGLKKIALIGHSKGGVKAAYYAAHQNEPRLAGLAVLSPAASVSGIFKNRWRRTPQAQERWLKDIEKYVHRGKGEKIYTLPNWPYLISAGTIWEHLHTSGDDVLENLTHIRMPIFAACGSTELSWCTVVSSLLEQPHPGVRVCVVDGADHVYTGREEILAREVISWLEEL